MELLQKLSIAWKALRELGLQQVGDYALYQLQLRSGYLGWRTRDGQQAGNLSPAAYRLVSLIRLPDQKVLAEILGDQGYVELLAQAGEILSGKVRLFGGDPVDLDLGSAASELHWTELEQGRGLQKGQDIRLTWEMGRLGWVFPLGRAYHASGEEIYAKFFWEAWEKFIGANPPYKGLHWMSGQEVAIRLIGLCFAAQVFSGSRHSTSDRMLALGRAVAAHARRIPPSLAYARAQNNNHLLVEAAGLYTAGCALPDYPKANSWRKLGWRWVSQALLDQIAPDGSYVQNSLNYHRLMLQAALWVHTLAVARGELFKPAVNRRLAEATHWLKALLEPENGGVPNLGPNDGAHLLPLSGCAFHDFRPAVQASARAFLGEPILPCGAWDEMGIWLGQAGGSDDRRDSQAQTRLNSAPDQPLVLRSSHSWAYLRAANFKNRPGHADQLHLDLWWRGQNIALDAGTYLYNAGPPWDNALARSLVHNTVTVNGLDQMTRAGRFLWLDWAQAVQISLKKAEDGSWQRAAAEHKGYRKLGIVHRRVVTAFRDDRWLVEDSLVADNSKMSPGDPLLAIRLHWLLPDWEWTLARQDNRADLQILTWQGIINLSLSWSESQANLADIQLVRAGELIAGSGLVSPILGCYSPTYGVKVPALSYSLTLRSGLPCLLTSEWRLT